MARDEIVKARWDKKFEKQKEEGELAQEKLTKFLKTALKDRETFKNLARDEIDARRNPTRQQAKISGSGFNLLGDSDPLPTGWEDNMWDNEDWDD